MELYKVKKERPGSPPIGAIGEMSNDHFHCTLPSHSCYCHMTISSMIYEYLEPMSEGYVRNVGRHDIIVYEGSQYTVQSLFHSKQKTGSN